MGRPLAHEGSPEDAPDGWARLGAVLGLPLAAYRPEHVARCIERAKAAAGVHAAGLPAAVQADPVLRVRLRRWVAVSHSGLFRDPQQFDVLEDLLPGLLERSGDAPRVWSAGCAQGLELWSLALVLQRRGALGRALLLGSDVLEENVAAARGGEAARRAGLDPAIAPRLRFERRDLTREPAPSGRWDLILCRNLAIYLAPDAKQRLHRLLAGALAPGGVLLLGRTERLGDPAAFGLRPVADRAYERRP